MEFSTPSPSTVYYLIVAWYMSLASTVVCFSTCRFSYVHLLAKQQAIYLFFLEMQASKSSFSMTVWLCAPILSPERHLQRRVPQHTFLLHSSPRLRRPAAHLPERNPPGDWSWLCPGAIWDPLSHPVKGNPNPSRSRWRRGVIIINYWCKMFIVNARFCHTQ